MVKSGMARETPGPKATVLSLPADELQIPDAAALEIVGRLRRVEGQVRAVQRLISERRDCHLIAQQLSAAKVALGRAAVQLMATRMAECIRSDDGGVDDNELHRLTSTFMKMLA